MFLKTVTYFFKYGCIENKEIFFVSYDPFERKNVFFSNWHNTIIFVITITLKNSELYLITYLIKCI